MTAHSSGHTARNLELIRWLLDSDPAIRWQVMCDLANEPEDVVAAERSRVGKEGWGAELLRRQGTDGQWKGNGSERQWESNLNSLALLREFGLDPKSGEAQKMIALVRDNVSWGPEFGNSPFFEGEVEPCINGAVLAIGAYFGEASDRLLERLLSEQLGDGGWNCEAERGSVRSSFHTTIRVLEGLLEYEHAKGPHPDVTKARLRGEEYMLERRMFRRSSTGDVISDRMGKSDWTRFSFPTTCFGAWTIYALRVWTRTNERRRRWKS